SRGGRRIGSSVRFLLRQSASFRSSDAGDCAAFAPALHLLGVSGRRSSPSPPSTAEQAERHARHRSAAPFARFPRFSLVAVDEKHGTWHPFCISSQGSSETQ